MAEIGLSGGSGLESRLKSMAGRIGGPVTLRVGFLEGFQYADGTSVALVAAVNEFGRPSIQQPPRPFFRNMIADKGPTWGPAIAKLLKTSQFDAATVLDQVGQAIAGQLQQSIENFTTPPIKPETARRKGFDKPLVDTGEMLASVRHQVVQG